MRKQRLFVWMLIVVLFAGAVQGVEKQVRIQRSDMVGTWIGLTTDELQMIRLALRPEGDGTIGYSFMDEEPCVFQLASWKFDAGKVELQIGSPIGRCTRDREFHGVAKGRALELTARGNGWSRSASLRREEALIDRWKKLEDSMNSGR